MVAQTRHSGRSPVKKKLAFSEKLHTKGIATDALLKKLKTLHSQLTQLEQTLVEVSSLNSIRKELVNTSILLHKDKGVKSYAACCLAEVLRLYAPDAPYTQAELRDIFQFFIRQLSTGLTGKDSPYYDQYFLLLESLSTVKSVVLVCDLPNAEELLAEIFRNFFALVRRDLSNKKVEMFIADILVALIDESQSLPSEVLETIMSQFMDKNARIEQPAYRLAVQVCNSTADRLQRHVSQYFSDIIYANARGDEEDFSEIRTAHDLIKRLYQSCPGLLHSVIPQLEEELRAEDNTPRSIAVQALGEMFAGKGGADLVKKYPTTWNVWLSRKNDKSPAIRISFVEATRGLITNHPTLKDTIEESLRLKLLDPDEKVRSAACKVFSQLDYESALHHVSEEQLRAVADRGKDKKQSVRVEALNSLGKLYSVAYPEMENNDPSAIKQFAWIPDEILQMMAINQDVRVVVEQVVADYIFPLPSLSNTGSKGGEVDEVAWTDRILNTMKYLTEKSINALLGLSGLKYVRPTVFDHLVEACVKYNGGVIDDDEELVTRKLHSIIQHIAGSYHDPHKASEDLNAFAKLNEPRLYKLLKTCMDPQSDLKGLAKAMHDFQKRLEQSAPNLISTMNILLRRASFRLINQSAIPTLLKRVQKSHGQAHVTAGHAQTLLNFISKHSPALYKSHVSELAKGLADEKNQAAVEVSLQALAAVAQWDPELSPSDSRTTERVARYALQSDPRHSKFAARFLAFSKNKEELCAEVIQKIAESIGESEPPVLVAQIAALSQLARYSPSAFELNSEMLMSFLFKNVLMTPIVASTEDMEMDDEWIEDDEVPNELKAKLLALKVCRNRSLAFASSENALEIATPVLKMFTTILENRGTLAPDANEDSRVMSRMRLQAAISLLHLSIIDLFATALIPKFLRMAVVVQDSCYNVRITFLSKLITLLQPRKIPPRFNVIPFLTIHDPETDVKMMAASYIQTALKKLPAGLRVEHLEMMFIRLLHLLAHHPDFSPTPEDLMDIARYVGFYLDLVGSAETISLLYHLAMKGKTVRDAESHGHSENFYVLCELAQELIKARAQHNGWSIQSYPGKVRLPSDILRPLPNAETVNKIVKRVYLPAEALTVLNEIFKSGTKGSSTKQEKKEKKTTGKRKATTKAAGPSKRARQTKKWKSDDEDDEESESEVTDSEVETDRRSERPLMSDPAPSENGLEGEPGSEDEFRRRLRPRRGKGRAAKASAKRSQKTETSGSEI